MDVKLNDKLWPRKEVRSLKPDGKAKTYGKTYYGKYGQRKILIVKGLRPRKSLETDLHEGLHAIFAFITEDEIKLAAKELAVLLYDQLGYRRQK